MDFSESPRVSTIRESIRRVLLEGPADALDLSQLVRIPERDVPAHLEHVRRSIRHRGEKLVVEPATCLTCGYEFVGRSRLTRPGSCPSCRGRRITRPRFRIDGAAGA